ncbi:MAG: HAMP domain-containing sensor histidine kinase [Acidimicrobiia bacterium]|nr:MAG: HAMP domain-containing sensor histidine kinase [Acidimicrobiia bacterium]
MRARLVAVAFAVTAMVALAFVVPLMILVRDLAADRELSAAERDAGAVARLVAVVGSQSIDQLVGPVLSAEGEFNDRPLTIVIVGGDTIGAPLDPGEDFAPAAAGTTFRQPVSGGQAIYIPVLGPDGETVVVRALAEQEAMRAGVATVWWTLAGLATVLVLLAVFVADRLGRSLVRPVDDLAATADRMGSGDLDARVEVAGPPEVRRVGTAFNRLAAQIGSLLQLERETAADLSHRLRTPLTGARLNADALPQSERKERLVEQLDDIERVVDHVIDEIRRPDRQARSALTDIDKVVAERVAFWEPLAADEGRELAVGINRSHALVAAPEADLAAALDALIGNIFAHTEPGIDLAVSVHRSNGPYVDVVVEDAGDGFPDDFSVAERGSSGADSTGLGLDIARRTAVVAGGDILLGSSPLGGAEVRMRLLLVGGR